MKIVRVEEDISTKIAWDKNIINRKEEHKT